jgi:hypothetical protein
MNSPVVQCLVGAILVLLGMFMALGLVRVAANLFVALVALAAVGFVGHAIFTGDWLSWGQIVPRSLGIGVLAALASLPALPFSSFLKRK